MKVILITQGSRGDVEPFIALARALADAGHEAILGASSTSVALSESKGVPTVSLPEISGTIFLDESIRAALQDNFLGLRGKYLFIKFSAQFRRLMESALDAMALTAKEEGDLVVHHVNSAGNHLAEMLGVRSIPVYVSPLYLPSSSFPYPLFPFPVPSAINRLTYLQGKFRRLMLQPSTQEWREKTLGLGARRNGFSRQLNGHPKTILNAFSKYLLPESSGYPDWVHTTGFWLPSECPTKPKLPKHLRPFMSAGSAPVYIGFGSMIGVDPVETGRIVAEAVRMAGVRAIVGRGWGGVEEIEGADDICYVDDVPFDCLFPQVSAIVHHGGAGTTGSALAAGRPQVVCPFVFEQYFYADRLHARGLAMKPLPQRELTAAKLAEAIHNAVTDQALQERCVKASHGVARENGVHAAVDILESVCEGNQSPGLVPRDAGFFTRV